MTTQEDNTTLIQTNDSVFFKHLLVLMLRERIASVEYDYTLVDEAMSKQNAKLHEQRTEIRNLLRRFCPSGNCDVSQFYADLSKPAAAIHFAAQQRFRVELPFELWWPQNRVAHLTQDEPG